MARACEYTALKAELVVEDPVLENDQQSSRWQVKKGNLQWGLGLLSGSLSLIMANVRERRAQRRRRKVTGSSIQRRILQIGGIYQDKKLDLGEVVMARNVRQDRLHREGQRLGPDGQQQ